MHEAEKTLKTDIQRDLFTRRLMDSMDDVYPLWHASAPERAEAFLRTIGKWEP